MSVIMLASSLSNCGEGRSLNNHTPNPPVVNSNMSYHMKFDKLQRILGKLILRHTFTRNLFYYCLILPIKRHQGPLHKGHQFWSSYHNLRQWDANRPVQGRFPQNEMSICCRDQWKKPIPYRHCLLAWRKTSTYTYANIRICKMRIIFMKVERHWSSFHQSRYVDPSYPSINPSIHPWMYLFECVYIYHIKNMF